VVFVGFKGGGVGFHFGWVSLFFLFPLSRCSFPFVYT
jgi:hypothetical protein